jgi:hypothetical protein
MRITGDSSREQVLWEWALAELTSPRLARFYPETPELRARVGAGGAFDPASELDQQVILAVRRFRSPLLKGLIADEMRFHRALLRPDEIGALRRFRDPEFRRIAPDAVTIADMATALAAEPPEHEEIPLAKAWRGTRAGFDPALMRGRPFLLAADPAGPYTLIEGYCRMLLLHGLHHDGRLGLDEVPVLLAIWPGLPGWRRYLQRKPASP